MSETSYDNYISNKDEIGTFIHCKKCIKELPEGQSPQDYRRYDVGWTKQGIQVWCVRHDINILHIDFQGQQHPANMTAKPPVTDDVDEVG